MKSYLFRWSDIALLALIGAAGYFQLFWVHDVYWDDNCWLLSRHATANLDEFLDHGFNQMRRSWLGVFLYHYYGIHIYSDHAFVIWNGISFATLLASIYAVYLLALTLSGENRLFALLVGVFYLSNSLDHTIPYVTAINYRIGFVLEIVSIYITSRSILDSRVTWPKTGLALFLTGVSAYVLTESVVAMEPVRLLISGYLLTRSGPQALPVVRQLAKQALLFGALLLPLVLYKVLYKPYGMYASIYQTSVLAALRPGPYFELASNLFFGFWRRVFYAEADKVFVFLGVATGLICFVRIKPMLKGGDSTASPNFLFVILCGGAVVLLQAFLFNFAGREFRWGPDSTHGIFMQFGMALVLAGVAHKAVSLVTGGVGRFAGMSRFGFAVIISVIAGYGVCVNNVNIALFRDGTAKQELFWKKFTERFPTLPPKAQFVFDVDISSFHDAADLDTGYDVEAYLNLLYATNTNPTQFHRYSVLAPEELRMMKIDFPRQDPISRMTRFGIDTIDPKTAIIIHYRGDRILVGKEILTVTPEVSYRPWIQSTDIELPPEVPSYPLRHKAF